MAVQIPVFFPKERTGAMSAISELKLTDVPKETDSLGEVDVPAEKLWGAQTQRSLLNFGLSAR